MMIRVSLIFPPTKRSITTPQTSTDFPVAGHAEENSTMRPGPFETRHNFIAFGNLFFYPPIHVRKRRSQSAQDILQPRDSRTLAGQGNLLHHIIPEKFPGGINLALVKNLFDKTTNNGAVVFHKLSVGTKRRCVGLVGDLILSSLLEKEYHGGRAACCKKQEVRPTVLSVIALSQPEYRGSNPTGTQSSRARNS